MKNNIKNFGLYYYDELAYWNMRKNPNNTSSKVTEQHINFIFNNLSECKNILDFGPGIGRVFYAYRNMKNVEGFDISILYKKRLQEICKQFSFNFTFVLHDKVGRLPYTDNYFDATVSSSVLLHQRPKFIVQTMTELARISKKVIAISTYDKSKPFDEIEIGNKKKYKHAFNYDYFYICKKNNLKISNKEIYLGGIMFVYEKTLSFI